MTLTTEGRSAGHTTQRSGVAIANSSRTRGQSRRFARKTPWLFLAPFLLFFGTFIVGPAVFGVWISLHDWDYTFPNKPFVGGPKEIGKELADLDVFPTPDEGPEFYVDYDETGPYEVELGESECAT